MYQYLTEICLSESMSDIILTVQYRSNIAVLFYPSCIQIHAVLLYRFR